MTRISNVRKTTKFKRSTKAISPVIATLLMIAIAVVASLVVYAWVTGYIGGTTSTAGKAIQIQSFAKDPTSGNLVIYVQNVGQGDVELNKDQSVYINSNLVSINDPSSTKIPIVEGQTVQLITNFPYDGEKVNIKVTTTDGTFMTASGTGKGTSTVNPTAPPGQYQIVVTQTANGVIAPGTSSYAPGSTPSFTITPNSGYHIASVTTNAGAQALTSPYVFPALSADDTLTATFEADTVMYQIVVTQTANGAIAPGTSSYAAGSTPSFSIIPSTGYHIATITANGGAVTVTNPAGQTYPFAPLSGDGTLTATYEADAVQQQVIYVSSGAGSGSTNGNPAPAYPSGLQVNDLILLQVTIRGDSTPTISVPSGFTLLRGPDATGGQSSRVTQWIYYKFSTGSETGTGTVTISGTSYDRAARMYAFRNVKLTSFTESQSYGIGEDDVILAQPVTTTGSNRLAISLVSVENDISVGSFTGESGGDWAEAIGEFTFNGDDDICMQIQTATMASAGTIQNGSYDTGSTSYRWVVTAFALIPA